MVQLFSVSKFLLHKLLHTVIPYERKVMNERTNRMSGFALLSAHPESGPLPLSAATIAALARRLEFASKRK